MSAEQTFLIRRNDADERKYRLHEVAWLWRTAQMPEDSVFQAANGEWRPVRELVEPLIENDAASPAIDGGGGVESAVSRSAHRWAWLAAGGVVVMVAAVMGPEAHLRYASWRTAKIAKHEAADRKRRAHTEDFVGDRNISPGMLPDQVRRILGPPRSVKATGDGSLERWIYRRQVVVFERGKVIGVEAQE